MTLTALTVWALANYGVCFLLADAGILARPRTAAVKRIPALAELLGCYFCLGFWVSTIHAAWAAPLGLETLRYGFAGATICYALDAALRRLDPQAEPLGDDIVWAQEVDDSGNQRSESD